MPSDIALNNQDNAGQTGDSVVIGGATYAIATDWGSGGGTGFTATHVQIVKPAWGDNYNTYRVSKIKPLPVQIFDGVQGTTGALIDGDNNALKITGGVKITDELTIAGNRMDGQLKPHVTAIIQVVGPTFGKSGPTAYGPGRVNEGHFAPVKVTGDVQGYTGMYPFSITFGGGLDKARPETSGEGQIRRLYGGPLGYTGATGYNLTTKNRRTLDRHIDTIAIQGMHHGTPVGVTGTTGGLRIRKLRYPANGVRSSLETGHASLADGDRVGVIGVEGATAIEVTGGIRLSHMPAGGSFEIRDLTYGRDSVAIAGVDGTTAAQFKLLGSNNKPIGASGDALMVAIDNGVFTGTLTVSQTVYVTNATGGSLKVKGATADELVVKGPLSGGAIEVASPSGLNIRNLASATDQVGLGGQALNSLNDIKNSNQAIENKQVHIGYNIASLRTNVDNLEWRQQAFAQEATVGAQPGGETGPGYDSNKPWGHRVYVQEVIQPETLIALSVTASPNRRKLGDGIIYTGLNVQADPANSSSVIVSSRSVAGGFVLEPGDSVYIQVNNLNKIYVKSTISNQKVNVLGS